MREIKFRAWNDIDKMIIDWDALKVLPVFFTNIMKGKVKHHNLMQYAGLTDKNGVEIYEGDICDVDGLGNCEVEICSLYGVTFKSDGIAYPAVDCIAENDTFKVIGNIYENPELLKAP